MRIKFSIQILATGFLLLAAPLVYGQEPAGKEVAAVQPDNHSWVAWGMTALIFFIVFLALNVYKRMKDLDENVPEQRLTFKQWWARVDAKFFTKAIPVEKEADFLLDHDYDGIKELDNSLPPWWKYGFYATIVIAVFYLLRFHVWKTGPNPEQEYNT